MPQSQPLSQELDARFSVFLNPIRDLTKNWEVDIAKVRLFIDTQGVFIKGLNNAKKRMASC